MGTEEAATQIIVAMIQNGMFHIENNSKERDAPKILTKQICEAYREIYATLFNPNKEY